MKVMTLKNRLIKRRPTFVMFYVHSWLIMNRENNRMTRKTFPTRNSSVHNLRNLFVRKSECNWWNFLLTAML